MNRQEYLMCLLIKAICDKQIDYDDVEIIKSWTKNYRDKVHEANEDTDYDSVFEAIASEIIKYNNYR